MPTSPKAIKVISYSRPAGFTSSEWEMLVAFRKAADSFDAKHGKTRATALRQLRKEGIVTKAGKLTKRYGD